MSFPNIPNIMPEIRLHRDDVINLLLASVAFEELGLAHLINAEAEKIQFDINYNASGLLKNVIKKEMLLQFKLEDIIQLIEEEEDDDDEG